MKKPIFETKNYTMLILKPNIIMEPLIGRYRSSPYLVNPCSAPRFLRHLIKKLLGSFIASPKTHETILKHPSMKGGPFVMLRASQKEEVEQILNLVSQRLTILFDIAQAQDELFNMLEKQEGFSLEPLYKKIPDPLRGYIELYYERSGFASYRMIESLMYRLPFYDETLQELLLYPQNNDQRDFVLTTPRLEMSRRLFLKLPHRAKAIDTLAKSRLSPIQNLEILAKECKVLNKDYPLFHSFFKENKQQEKQQTTNLSCTWNVKMRYFGHACVELRTLKTVILIDPLIAYSHVNQPDSRLTYTDLPNHIDAILITHLHLDHFCIETLIQIRHKVKLAIVPKSCGGTSIDICAKKILTAIGFKNVIEIDSMDSIVINDFKITALPFYGEHGSLDIIGKSVYYIESKTQSFLLLADTRVNDEKILNRIKSFIGSVDTLFLGMESQGAPASWFYGPLLDKPIQRKFDQTRRLNGSDYRLAKELIKVFNPSSIRVYALGREPWLSHIMHIDTNPQSAGQLEIDQLTQFCEKRDLDIQTLYINAEETY